MSSPPCGAAPARRYYPVRAPFRLACLAAAAAAVGIPRAAPACLPPEPPSPPPRTASESESDFAERSRKWYADLFEAQDRASLPGRVAEEERLWATAGRVALARVEKVGSIRLRGSGGYWYKSPLVTLRTIRWLKGHPSPRRLKVHFLSDDSCDFGGAGDAAYDGEAGDVFLLFYKPGPIDPRNILDTFDRARAVTPRSRAAFDLERSARP